MYLLTKKVNKFVEEKLVEAKTSSWKTIFSFPILATKPNRKKNWHTIKTLIKI